MIELGIGRKVETQFASYSLQFPQDGHHSQAGEGTVGSIFLQAMS
jgi:hypothetical protein